MFSWRWTSFTRVAQAKIEPCLYAILKYFQVLCCKKEKWTANYSCFYIALVKNICPETFWNMNINLTSGKYLHIIEQGFPDELLLNPWRNFGSLSIPGKIHHCCKRSSFEDTDFYCGLVESQTWKYLCKHFQTDALQHFGLLWSLLCSWYSVLVEMW